MHQKSEKIQPQSQPTEVYDTYIEEEEPEIDIVELDSDLDELV